MGFKPNRWSFELRTWEAILLALKLRWQLRIRSKKNILNTNSGHLWKSLYHSYNFVNDSF